MKTKCNWTCTALWVLCLLPLAQGADLLDEGKSNSIPWSGYWWPFREGGMVHVLEKYDRLFSTSAAELELKQHPPHLAESWFGYCGGLAAASVAEAEPIHGRSYRDVLFSVGDQKGLLCACHSFDAAHVYGDRFGDNVGSDDHADLPPDHLWRLLQWYIQQHRVPLILDLDAGNQVWNHPVYAYQVALDQQEGNWFSGTMRLKVVANNVPVDFVGTTTVSPEYTFRVQVMDGAIVVGSGKWIGKSEIDHPDFAWFPYLASAENHKIDPDLVSQIVGAPVGSAIDAPVTLADSDRRPTIAANPTELAARHNDVAISSTAVTDERIPDTTAPMSDVDENLPQDTEEASPEPSRLGLDAWLDRFDGGTYRAGDALRLSLRTETSGFLYVFEVGPKSSVQIVFPLESARHRVEANKEYDVVANEPVGTCGSNTPRRTLRERNAWETIRVGEVIGAHELRVIVTGRPIPACDLAQSATVQSLEHLLKKFDGRAQDTCLYHVLQSSPDSAPKPEDVPRTGVSKSQR